VPENYVIAAEITLISFSVTMF